ncbi:MULTISPECIES: thiamine pyrophosphate-dependent enzyme [Burkholderia]|uniref:thiamine pyrophosphate-dependent enzyme n=1 Tax=Burkholderia TaxID=32008 RepID=UPI00119ADE03|nr:MULTISPECIES: thiamine pyrophosphate-dependent enzyme [Burkholderia]MBU9198316.1 hypothetical protein [Burkholderia gladioli]MDC6128112.1 thiamine pyrophosphate-dependent enzyme [Burkholderia gladioli]MDN7737529.1 thiamine pyrophosphate-dependent enzyme [Burkholderia gladioli]TWC73011.1 thiamine pyrophosphate-dependent enzyme [Burkholderia sp. SJZ089]TWD03444.1 thiamine pyrophosphate-dependent enzyme [Burkholderia sp. SJZ115]
MTMNQQAGPMTGIPSTGGSPAAPEPGKSRRGSALYAPQALWTAAHEHLPVTFVIVNNRSYDILKNFMKSQHHFASVRAGRFIGMDLDEPPIDFLALAAPGACRHVVSSAPAKSRRPSNTASPRACRTSSNSRSARPEWEPAGAHARVARRMAA